MLNHLSLDDYQRYAPEVTDAFKRAARFLCGQGFVDGRFLPYGSQLIPLAAIFATLGKLADPFPAQVRLERWFWCGVFGELYSGAIESCFAADLPQVVGWSRGGEEPKTIADAQFTSSRLLTMRTKNSAVGLKADRFNSIINKTPLSAYANRSIGAKAPSVNVKELASHANDISGHVESHLINVGALLRDDFEAFWTAREDALLDQIENAMGKAVHRE